MKLATEWIPVVHRGLLALLFGLLTILGSDKSIGWFTPLMLFYAMGDGVLAMAASARAAYAHERWVCLLIEGLAGLSGILLITAWPEAKFSELTWSLAGWAVVTAVGAVVTAASLGKRATREWLLAAAGLVLLRFAVLAIGAVRAGEIAIALSCGAGALIFAAVFLAGIRLGLAAGGGVSAGRLQLFAR